MLLKNHFDFFRRPVVILILGAVLFFWFSVTGFTQPISEGYITNDRLLRDGMAAQLSFEGTQPANNGNYIERADINTPERFVGVVTSSGDSFATIGKVSDTVFVQRSGEVQIYVTDAEGTIKAGDSLTLSSLRGIFQKSGSDQTNKRAIALSDTEASNKVEYNGITTKANIHKILASIEEHGNNSNQIADNGTLAKISRAVVGKDVGELRVVIALLVFGLLMVVEGGVVYSAISSSITSIGRNPLAGGAIKKELVRVLLIAIFILSVGLGIMYLVLWI